MSETIGTAQIEVTGDARGFDSTVKQAKKSLADLGATASKTGKDTASGMGQAGAATDKLDAATKRAAASIERQALALGKSKAEYYAAKAAIDGNSAALAPYIAKLREAEANVSATAKAQKSLADSSTSTARAFGAIAAGLSVAKLVQMADAVTTLQNQLKLATGSTAGAAVAYEALFDIAQRSRVSFTELGSVYASVARAGATLGVSQGRLLKVTESIGNALTISGGSAASMQAALVQLSQGLASGTLRGEELNSVMEQTPRLAKALADGLGVSIGELREMGKAGLLTSEQVIQALESQSAALASEVRNATLSVGQAFTVLQNSATKFVGDADKATGASATLAGALVSLSKGIDSVGKSLSENGTLITTVLGGVAGAGALAGLAAVAGNLGKIRLAVVALSAVLAANPITLALLGIGAVVGGAVAYNSAASKTVDGMKRTMRELESMNKTGPGIYSRDAEGMKSWEEGVARRNTQIRELRQQIALLDTQQLDTRAEDARFAASTRNAKANEQLAESMEGIRLRVAGVSKDYTQFYSDLAVYQKARESGMVTEQEYVALVSQLSIEYAKGTKATKENKDAEQERWDGIKKRRQEQVDDTNSYLAGLQILAKEEADAAAAVAKAYASAMEKQDSYTATLREQVERQLEQNAAIGLTAEELVNLEVAKLNDAAASKERLASDLAAAGESDRLVQAYRDQAAELRKLGAAKADGGAKQAGADAAEVAREAAKQATEDWKRAAAEMESDITDALMRGFESGKGFADVLRDTVVNMFKTMVLRPVIQGVVQGGLNAVGLGGPGGGGSGLLGSAANAASLYNQLSTGTGLVGSVLASNAAYGAAIGTTSIGAGSQAAMLAAQTGQFGAAGVAATSQAAAGAGAGASSALSAIPGWGWALAGLALLAGSGFGKSPGEQHLGGYYSSAGRTGMDAALAVTGGGGDGGYARDLIDRESAGLKTFTQMTVDGVLSAAQKNAKALGLDIALGIDAGVAANLNGKGKNKNAFGYAQIFANGELAGEYKNRELGSDLAQAGATFTADLANEVAKAMLQGGGIESRTTTAFDASSGRFVAATETASQTLDRLVGSLSTVNSVFDTLGVTAYQASLAGADMASMLADAFGGMESLAAATGSYYEAYYSEAERTATTTRQVTEAMADLGVALPASREQFRAIVEAQDLTTESGRSMYAALLKLAPAFDQVAASSDALQARSKELTAGLQGAIDQAIGKFMTPEEGVGYKAGRLGDELRGLGLGDFSAEQLLGFDKSAIYDYVAAIVNSGDMSVEAKTKLVTLAGALVDLQGAGDAAGGAVSEILSSLQADRTSIERELLALRGGDLRAFDTKGYTAAELAAYDYNEALRAQIVEMQSAADAAEQAGQAAQQAAADFAAAQQRIVQERYGLETQLLQLQGNTAELRRRELDALDPSNRALQQQIWAMEDQAAAAQASAARISQVRDEWKSLTDSIVDEVRRIRGELISEGSMGYTDVQARFALASAQARAGSQSAAGELPELSRTLLDLARLNVASAEELRYVQALTASSLESTLKSRGVKVPAFAVGTNYVPADMLALVHKGEAIVPTAYNPAANPALRAPSSDQREVVEELRALNNRVAALEAPLRATQYATADAARTLQEAATLKRPLGTTAA